MGLSYFIFMNKPGYGFRLFLCPSNLKPLLMLGMQPLVLKIKLKLFMGEEGKRGGGCLRLNESVIIQNK